MGEVIDNELQIKYSIGYGPQTKDFAGMLTTPNHLSTFDVTHVRKVPGSCVLCATEMAWAWE